MTPDRPVILVDVDGVLADFPGAVQRSLRLTQPLEHWDVKDSLVALGLPSDRVQDLTEQYEAATYRRGWCRAIEPYRYAGLFVTQLRKLGRVVALTAPFHGRPYWLQERLDWLQDVLGFSARDVVFCPSDLKPLVDGDYLIEDRPDTLVAWAERRAANDPHMIRSGGFLVGQPYNREARVSPHYEANLYLSDVVSRIRNPHVTPTAEAAQ